MGHRQVLHPAPTLRKFFAKHISLLRDRYRPGLKLMTTLPTQAGWQANPEWRSVTARTHPASGRPAPAGPMIVGSVHAAQRSMHGQEDS